MNTWMAWKTRVLIIKEIKVNRKHHMTTLYILSQRKQENTLSLSVHMNTLSGSKDYARSQSSHLCIHHSSSNSEIKRARTAVKLKQNKCLLFALFIGCRLSRLIPLSIRASSKCLFRNTKHITVKQQFGFNREGLHARFFIYSQ